MPPRDMRRSGLGSKCGKGDKGCSRKTVKEQADTMNSPSSADSIRYSGQWASKARTPGDRRSGREFAVSFGELFMCHGIRNFEKGVKESG